MKKKSTMSNAALDPLRGNRTGTKRQRIYTRQSGHVKDGPVTWALLRSARFFTAGAVVAAAVAKLSRLPLPDTAIYPACAAVGVLVASLAFVLDRNSDD